MFRLFKREGMAPPSSTAPTDEEGDEGSDGDNAASALAPAEVGDLEFFFLSLFVLLAISLSTKRDRGRRASGEGRRAMLYNIPRHHTPTTTTKTSTQPPQLAATASTASAASILAAAAAPPGPADPSGGGGSNDEYHPLLDKMGALLEAHIVALGEGLQLDRWVLACLIVVVCCLRGGWMVSGSYPPYRIDSLYITTDGTFNTKQNTHRSNNNNNDRAISPRYRIGSPKYN